MDKNKEIVARLFRVKSSSSSSSSSSSDLSFSVYLLLLLLLLLLLQISLSLCIFFFFLRLLLLDLPCSLAAMSLRPNARAEVRKKAYKVSVDADEARRKREDNLVEIRKNKREENLLKKRKEGLNAQPVAAVAAVRDDSVEKKVSGLAL
jgi:hypothetical protein